MLPTESQVDETQLFFTIAEGQTKKELPNDLRVRYWEAVEECQSTIADKKGFLGENQFHPLLVIGNENDPKYLSELYSGKHDAIIEQRQKQGVFYRLAQIHTAAFGEIEAPIYPGKGFKIEEIRAPEASHYTTLDDATKFIYVGKKNFEQVTQSMNTV